jgi:hypothetical protein
MKVMQSRSKGTPCTTVTLIVIAATIAGEIAIQLLRHPPGNVEKEDGASTKIKGKLPQVVGHTR